MASRARLIAGVREILSQRHFSEPQIEKVLPRLHDGFFKEPEHLSEIIDTWNVLMSSKSINPQKHDPRLTPPLATPPKSSLMGQTKISMNTILADIEPDLLLLEPQKLLARHQRIKDLGLTKNLGEEWIVLFNAPRGFYLQDWLELSKKIYYVEQRVVDFLFDKREQKSMDVHPIVKSAAVTEVDFDHIRTRYLFALRCGYQALSHMYSVQTALKRPTLQDIILADNESYLAKFAPFCSVEEYNAFSNLMKNTTIDEDDAEIFEKLAELNALGR